MRERRHVPIRMCIGCRKKRKKEEMIRLTQTSEGGLWIDERKHHPGRGFYLCPNLGCLNRVKKKSKGRVLLVEGRLSSSIEGFSRKLKDWNRGERE